MKLEYLRRNGIMKALLHYSVSAKRKICNGIIRFITKIEQKFPLRDAFIFECESDMDDNPRAIYEYMIKEGLNQKYKIIWIVKDVDFCKENYCNENVCFISRFDNSIRNQIRLNYYLATSKWLVFSHPYWFKKKRTEQFVLNTWHGLGMKGFRKGDSDISDTFDKVLATSPFAMELLSQAWPKNKFEIKEYPRSDFLFNVNKDKIVKEFFPNYNSGEKVIMCMPTFRQSTYWEDSQIVDRYSLGVVNTDEELFALNSFLEDHQTYLLVKLHPLQNLALMKSTNLSNIRYVLNREIFERKLLLYSVLGCCDALLTDVSSVYIDYLVLNRPIGFFMDNFWDFERGYIVSNPLDYMPGEKISNLNDLYIFIDNLSAGKDNYAEERNKVCKLFHAHSNQDNGKRVLEWLVKEEVKK